MNVGDFLNKILTVINDSDCFYFYRGSSRTKYNPIPTVLRPGLAHDENYYYKEMLKMCPDEFRGLGHYETLTKMRHFGNYNRLMDVTSNPLVGLYFACQVIFDEDGMVTIYKARKKDIANVYSDRAMMLACIPALSESDKNDLYALCLDRRNSNTFYDSDYEKPFMVRFLHEIKREFPSFEKMIRPLDLINPLFVAGAENNQRIINQSGSFIIFGLDDYEIQKDEVQLCNIIIPASDKRKMLEQLSALNINQGTIYPDIQHKVGNIIGQLLDFKEIK